MKVWDRIHCRWIAWHSFRAAWLRLPHAVAVAGCVALVLHPVPGAPAREVLSPTPASQQQQQQPSPPFGEWDAPPQAFLPPLTFPYPWFSPVEGYGGVPIPIGGSRPVSEPPAALLLGVAVVAIAALRRLGARV